MSTYMFPEKTTAIIAKYLAEGCNSWLDATPIVGVKVVAIEPNEMKAVKEFKACFGKDGRCSSAKVYAKLRELNSKAVLFRYGNSVPASEFVSGKMQDVEIETGPDNMRQWLANLYTVTEGFVYQCAESPNVKLERASGGGLKSVPVPMLALLEKWKAKMADTLAEYVVDDVRGSILTRKHWSEF